MTIESNFLDLEDSEKFAASIQRKPLGMRDFVNAITKVINKDNWGRVKDELREAQKISFQDKVIE